MDTPKAPRYSDLKETDSLKIAEDLKLAFMKDPGKLKLFLQYNSYFQKVKTTALSMAPKNPEDLMRSTLEFKIELLKAWTILQSTVVMGSTLLGEMPESYQNIIDEQNQAANIMIKALSQVIVAQGNINDF